MRSRNYNYQQYKFIVVYCESVNFDWLYYRFLSADRKQLRISAHRASRLNLMSHNKTVLFYALLDISSFYARDYGKFILKQLDYSPPFSTICSQKTRARCLIVNCYHYCYYHYHHHYHYHYHYYYYYYHYYLLFIITKFLIYGTAFACLRCAGALL